MIINSDEISLHVGEIVQVKDMNRRGSVESIRVISKANMVESYSGSPKDVVITIQMGDTVVCKRGIELAFTQKPFAMS